jgi:SAM-dependent methyltransferase
VTDQGERYDRMAAGYERWWAPVLAPSALAVLDLLEDTVVGGPRDLIDIGVGTGNLARPALVRWPTARITGIDASGEMLDAARALVDDLGPEASQRFTGDVADAAALPYPEASFDAAMSSFVLQLVRSRPAALREIRRVLRPGGHLAFVTWIADRTPFAPDRVFDALLVEFGYDEEVDAARNGDIPSAERAAAELRRAGFRDVTATRADLAHAFDADGYIGFLTDFDEETLFEEMPRRERHRFLARLRERLMALDPDALVFRAPIVYATGRRSDG